MTDDRTDGSLTGGASGQQFIVEHGDKLYRTQVVGEVDQQEVSSFQQAEPAGRAFLDPGGAVSVKSMPGATSFANIGDESTDDMAAPSTAANIGDETNDMAAPSSMANIEDNN